jgi:uncharacterized protein YkwD
LSVFLKAAVGAGLLLGTLLAPPRSQTAQHGSLKKTRATQSVSRTAGISGSERTESYDSSDPFIREIEKLEQECHSEVNRLRAANRVAPLSLSDDLRWAARAYSRRMAEEGFFSHTDPEGRMIRDRLAEAGVKWRSLGENIASNKGYVNPVAACMRGWMDSSGHKRNILNPEFDNTAIGVWIAADGTFFFTQIFIKT